MPVADLPCHDELTAKIPPMPSQTGMGMMKNMRILE
jgi:hypothetical protein